MALARVRGFLLSIFANRLINCASDVSRWRICLIDKTIEGAFGSSMAGIAIVVLAIVYLVSRLKPAWERGPLGAGGLAVAYVLYHDIKVQLEAMTNARFKTTTYGRADSRRGLPVPLVARGLLFDLVFVWRRYIRYAGEGEYLSLPCSREAWRQQRRGSGGTILTTFRTNSSSHRFQPGDREPVPPAGGCYTARPSRCVLNGFSTKSRSAAPSVGWKGRRARCCPPITSCPGMRP